MVLSLFANKNSNKGPLPDGSFRFRRFVLRAVKLKVRNSTSCHPLDQLLKLLKLPVKDGAFAKPKTASPGSQNGQPGRVNQVGFRVPGAAEPRRGPAMDRQEKRDGWNTLVASLNLPLHKRNERNPNPLLSSRSF